MTDQPEGTVRLNINMEQSLHRRFKALCASTGQRMTDVTLELIKAYIKDPPAAPSTRKAAKK